MTEIVSFGEWVQTRRNHLRLTRAGLARQVGCATVTLKKIERDERRPSIEIAQLLADHLQIPTAEQGAFIRRARGEFVAQMASPDQLPMQPVSLIVRKIYSPPPHSGQDSFVGRQAEVSEIQRLLQTEASCRFLTLIGSGGIGKTQLALEAARILAPSFADGVCFVPLAPLADASFLLSAIIDGLELQFAGGVDRRQHLLMVLQDKNLLLLLDNFEHLLVGNDEETGRFITLLSDIVQAAPQLKLLVTSRERLNLPEEWGIEIGGMPFPETPDLPDDGENVLASYTAITLFTQRAKKAKAGFKITADTLPDIIRICQLVEGMPLGLELAAAWVRLLSCQEIALEIERNLDFLITTQRNRATRHQSLRAMFDYSWSLLSSAEQRLLSQLSVFRGGFGRHAAEQICEASLLDLLSLIDKSLLQRGADGRFDIHELLRQFAAEKLGQQPDLLKAVEGKYGRYYLTWLHEIEPDLLEGKQAQLFPQIHTEIDNIQRAWQLATKEHAFQELSVAICSLNFYYIVGHLQDGEKQLGSTLESLRKVDTASTSIWYKIAYASVLNVHAFLISRLGDSQTGQRHLQTARALLSELQRQAKTTEAQTELLNRQLVFNHITLGHISALNANYAEAYRVIEGGFHLLSQIEHPFWAGLIYGQKGFIAEYAGHTAEAEVLLQQGMSFLEVAGENGYSKSQLLTSQGRVALFKGEYRKSKPLLTEAADIRQQIKEWSGLAYTLAALGDLAEAQGDLDAALQQQQQGLQVAQQVGDPYATIYLMAASGRVYVAREEWEAATELSTQAISICHRIGEKVVLVLATNNLGHIALKTGAADLAYTHFQTALRLTMPLSIDFMAAEALLGLAEIESQKGNKEQAIALLTSIAHYGRFAHYPRSKAHVGLSRLGSLEGTAPFATLAEMAEPYL